MENYEKKYKSLVEAVKTLKEANPSDEGIQNWVKDNVPELKESEDWIPKEIIKYLKEKGDFRACWIAWLEKQRPINPTMIEKERIDNAFTKMMLKEHKPSNTVKPKFKIGDFLVNDYCMGKVIELTNDAYLLDTGQGIPFSCEHNVHLWTINDAKDGDVIAFDNGTIVIFKDLYNATTFHSYCHIEDDIFDISKDDMPDWWEGEGFHPATKEQRDTLMKAMADAGYTFDFDKKELKKIEQKPQDWSDEDDEMLSDAIGFINTGCSYRGKSHIVYWLNTLKERCSWKPSKEQMHALNEVINYCAESPSMHENDYRYIILTGLRNQLRKL